MQTHSWGPGVGGGVRGGDDFFAFFLPEKKYDFNKYKGFLIFLL
jgi:hypothetical protein